MKAKQTKHSQAERYYYQPHTVDLTKQERRALSLVWSEPDEPEVTAVDSNTEHCAVLGYN